MTELASITLENEMDLVIAHKRMVGIAEYLQFTLATQTTLATAIVEACREVIDKTNHGRLAIGIVFNTKKYFLSGKIYFPVDAALNNSDGGMSYARKLVPSFDLHRDAWGAWADMQISIPRFVQLSPEKLKQIAVHFKSLPPATPYEEIKLKNTQLSQVNLQQDEQLRLSKNLDEKKNEFISIASHELKTPLTTIKAYTQLALKTGTSECTPQMRGFLEKIDMQSAKLQRLIQQLLDVSIIETGTLDFKIEEVDFGEFMESIIELLKPILPNYQLHLERSGLTVIVRIDKLRMEQVFANLLNNAAKYSAAGSNIYIKCSLEENNTIKKVRVQDEGIGMSKENLEQIFKKYFREERAIKNSSGLGMGLYICRNIIQEHGGKIWAESEPGKGSAFIFTIPVEKVLTAAK